MKTLNYYIQQYLANSKFKHAHSSFMSNRSKANNIKMAFGDRDIADIIHSEIETWVVEISEKLSNKTINDHLSIFRKIFRTAVNDGVITLNPMTDIVTLPTCKTVPTPFLKDELLALKNTDTDDIGEKNLLFLGVLTGLRMCELLSLTWDCVDFEKAEIQVNKAVVLGKYKLPKTKESFRKVELNSYALKLLKNQFEETGLLEPKVIKILQEDNRKLVEESVQHVFISSLSHEPFGDVKEFSTSFFHEFLAKAGVKKRGANQVRHTFASQSLIIGISMEWLRIQMGHTTTQMIEEHYGKWLIVDAPDYSNKLGLALSDVFEINVVRCGIEKSGSTLIVASWGGVSDRESSVNKFGSCTAEKWEIKRCA